MDKICSFLIILIVAYISYNYCSKTIEGVTSAQNPGLGTYDLSQDRANTPPTGGASGSGDVCADSHSIPCINKDADCLANSYPGGEVVYNRDNYRYKEDNDPERNKCMQCVMYSDKTSRLASGLSEIGTKNRTQTSEFARNYCDALVADCDSPLNYSIGETDFYKDCGYRGFMHFDDTINDNYKLYGLCTIMTNPIFMFFFELMKGVLCDMNIRAKMIVRDVEDFGTNLVSNIHIPGT